MPRSSHNAKRIVYQGNTYNQRQFSDLIGVSESVISTKLSRGMTPDEIVLSTIKKPDRIEWAFYYKVDGREQKRVATLKEWADELHVDPRLLKTRRTYMMEKGVGSKYAATQALKQLYKDRHGS